MSNEYYRYVVIVMLIAIFPGDHAYAQNQKKAACAGPMAKTKRSNFLPRPTV